MESSPGNFERPSFEETGEPLAKDSPPLLGYREMFILSSCLGIAVYFLFFRKTKKVDIVLQPLTRSMMAPADSGIINKMKRTGKNVVVFYGSQTGTAEEFAQRLAKDAISHGMKGFAYDPEECDLEDLARLPEVPNSLAIFCMATYGEGDPTDNALEIYQWLQEGSVRLDGVHYSVFGLGNKTYEHYNLMGQYVDKRLAELGAERVFELGLGNDDANIEEDFVTWRESFWPAVCSYFGVEGTGEFISQRQYSLTVHEEGEVDESKVYTGEIARLKSFQRQKPPFDAKNPYLSPVVVSRELHKGGDRSCIHMELDISGSKLRYEAGDHVAIYPTNDSSLVKTLGELLNVNLDTLITLTNVDEDATKKHPFPCPCTYRTALTHYLDISGTPTTAVLRELAEYAADPKERDFLIEMSSSTAAGKKLYSDWVKVSQRSIVHILKDLPSVTPPIDHLCELLQRLQSRFYSISSSSKVCVDKIHITFVVVDYETKAGHHVNGVATGWLRHKQPPSPSSEGDSPAVTVPIYVRKSTFRLPMKPSTPVVMIGPGTGLAPFRGFIQERALAKQQGKPVGDTLLFFGCRNRDVDYIYREELEGYVADEVLTGLFLAFSRDGPNKVYVQHIMRENKEKLWKAIEDGGHIYVCGDAKNMARDVLTMLEEVVKEFAGLSSEQAKQYVNNLSDKGRYCCDVWS